MEIRHFPFELGMLSSLIHSVPLSIYAKDNAGRFIFANVHYCENVGKNLRDIIGKTDHEIHPKELADKYRADDRLIMESRETRKIEESWKSIGGDPRYVQVIKTPLLDNMNPDRIIGTVGVFWDITERKMAEKQIHEERNFLRTVIDTIPSFVYAKDVEGRFVIANRAVANFMGEISPDELIGKSDYDFFENEVAEVFDSRERELFATGRPVDDVVETYSHRGEEYAVSTTKKPLYNLAGELTGLVGVGHDITRLKMVEKQLRESEERYAAVMSQAIEGIYLVDPGTKKILESNKSFQNMLGYSGDELSGMVLYDFILHSRDEVDAIFNSVMARDDLVIGNRKYRVKDGGIIEVEVSAKCIEFAESTAVLAIVRDISERKKAEKEKEALQERLRQAQKLEAIGTLAGGVAHDLNNILAGIVSYPEIMLLSLPEDSPLREQLETIQKSGERAAAVVTDLLTVARGVASKKENQPLNSLVVEQLESPENSRIARKFKEIEFTVRLNSRVGSIYCSPVHVKKCVMNLVINAAEAISGPGHVDIGTDSVVVTPKSHPELPLPPGEYHVITVRDDGPGISSEDSIHIFEPFYTKKKLGASGSGLGLSIVWNTMLDHDGTVIVESGGGGTLFTLFFPAIGAPAPMGEEHGDPSEFYGNGERILVVDDDPHLLEIARKMLEGLGYWVACVGSGEEALAHLQIHTVDLVLLDMLMDPGMNGYETYSHIIEQNPGQRAVIVSGYSESRDVSNAQQLGAGRFIPKPYSLRSLGEAVWQELNR